MLGSGGSPKPSPPDSRTDRIFLPDTRTKPCSLPAVDEIVAMVCREARFGLNEVVRFARPAGIAKRVR